MAKEKRGLGTGLGVLFGENELEEEDSGLLFLPVSKIEAKCDQPRTYFDEEALQALADSIKLHGIIQPITVRAMPTGYYQIIAGERRWRASRLAGLEEIPARIIEVDDRKAAELALVENLQREDLNPVEEAQGYKTLIEDYGLTQDEAAKSVGKSRPAITNALRILSLTPDVLKMVETREISAGHAKVLVSIADSSVQLDAAKDVVSKNLSVRKTEQLVSRLSKQSDEPSSKEEEKDCSKTIDYSSEISAELTKMLGRKVKLTDGSKIGKIEMEFYGPEDRESLIACLKKIKS